MTTYLGEIKCPSCNHWQIPINYCPKCGYKFKTTFAISDFPLNIDNSGIKITYNQLCGKCHKFHSSIENCI